MKTHFLSLRVLVFGICASGVMDTVTPRAVAQALPARIDIVVVEGEGVINNARQPVARNLVVRVEDVDHRPIAGASVVFALPVAGPTGSFVNGATSLTIVTDAAGEAVARGLRTNQNPGKLQIYVTASYRGLSARALITQFIEAAPGAPAKEPELRSHSGGKWKWVCAVLDTAIPISRAPIRNSDRKSVFVTVVKARQTRERLWCARSGPCGARTGLGGSAQCLRLGHPNNSQ